MATPLEGGKTERKKFNLPLSAFAAAWIRGYHGCVEPSFT